MEENRILLLKSLLTDQIKEFEISEKSNLNSLLQSVDKIVQNLDEEVKRQIEAEEQTRRLKQLREVSIENIKLKQRISDLEDALKERQQESVLEETEGSNDKSLPGSEQGTFSNLAYGFTRFSPLVPIDLSTNKPEELTDSEAEEETLKMNYGKRLREISIENIKLRQRLLELENEIPESPKTDTEFIKEWILGEDVLGEDRSEWGSALLRVEEYTSIEQEGDVKKQEDNLLVDYGKRLQRASIENIKLKQRIIGLESTLKKGDCSFIKNLFKKEIDHPDDAKG